jgi:hypothetical protein
MNAVRQSDAGIAWEIRKEMESRGGLAMEEEGDEDEDSEGEDGEAAEDMEAENEGSTPKVRTVLFWIDWGFI